MKKVQGLTINVKLLNSCLALVLLMVGFTLVLSPLQAFAQDAFPNRAVKLVVPSPPGSIHDTFARFLAEFMRTELNQSIVIENKAGATGMIASMYVANAPADGYTVLVTSLSNHVLAPIIQRSQNFDSQKQLKPIGVALTTMGLMLVSKATEANNLKAFVELAKKTPGKLNYGSAGLGSTINLQTEMFKELAGIDMTHVAYKGSIPALNGLMGNEVQFMSIDLATGKVAIASGNAKPIAQTGPRRHSSLPLVPTLIESGYGSFTPSFWLGLAAPKGTSDAVVKRLNLAMNNALNKSIFKDRAESEGWVLLGGGGPEVLEEMVSNDIKHYSAVVKKLNLYQ